MDILAVIYFYKAALSNWPLYIILFRMFVHWKAFEIIYRVKRFLYLERLSEVHTLTFIVRL
jgi:hypothetical protein